MSLKIQLISDDFVVQDYLKFWENRLNLKQRKTEINNKIQFKKSYQSFFNNKKVIMIDDVVSTGISLAEIAINLWKFNQNLTITALAYGSVYQWEKIYS